MKNKKKEEEREKKVNFNNSQIKKKRSGGNLITQWKKAYGSGRPSEGRESLRRELEYKRRGVGGGNDRDQNDPPGFWRFMRSVKGGENYNFGGRIQRRNPKKKKKKGLGGGRGKGKRDS